MSGGSAGGYGFGGGGGGGTSNPLGTGGMGSTGSYGSGGGGGGDGATGGAGGNGGTFNSATVSGGAGATSPGGAGGFGAYGYYGGSGGGGGATGLVSTSSLTVDEATFGGAGGRGGSSGVIGGGGGGGADGAALSGSGLTLTVLRGSGLFGGAGGDGGYGGSIDGSGGGGGGGIYAGSGNTIVNNGTIIGGSGGSGGSGGARSPGGVAIVGSNLTIVNTGTIDGGLSGDGSTLADAIDFTSGTNHLTLGGAIDGGIGISGNLQIATTRDTTLDDAIHDFSNGAGSLVYDSANTLTLAAANTYSGGTTIEAGTVSLAHSTGGSIDAADTGTIFVYGGGALELANSGTLTNEVDFDSGTGTMEAATGVTATFVGAFAEIAFVGATNIVFGSKNATGTIVFASSNVAVSSPSAPTIEIAGGTLRDGGYLDGLFDLPSSSTPVTVQIDSGATLDLNGYADQIETLTGSGTLTNAAGGSVTIDGGSFAGVIAGGGNVVIGSGATVTLTGVETFTGKTSVSGTLALTGTASVHSSTKVALTKSGATLDMSGATGGEVINKLGGISGTVTDLGNQNLKIKVQTGTVDVYAGTIKDGGVAGGTGGSVTLGGLGELSLTAANSYTGGTTLDAGTLDLAAQGAAGTGTITFANPSSNGVATLEIDAAALSGGNGAYTFANKIAGATSTNQVIDLRSLGYVQGSTSATVIGGTTLVVNDGSSTVTLTLASSTSKSSFVTASDSNGGTLVYDPPAASQTATGKVDTHWIEMAMADFGGVAGEGHAHHPMHDPFGLGAATPFDHHHAHAGKLIRGA